MESRRVYSVSELNSEARTALEQAFTGIWVKGEITQLTRAASGHLYFTLKDEDSELSAVRFKSRSALLAPIALEQGDDVLAFGHLTVYEPRGRYQFIATLLQPVGAGALQRAFENLKVKLQDEGLFDPDAKKPLPRVPRSIGVITSPQGAALRDIVSVLSRRWPSVELFLFSSLVQGETAPQELREALHRAIRFSVSQKPLDLLIVTRGGGSAEDLAAFNDEALARDLHACPIPTLSAVGHEIDFSITDFVADRRAPTPSVAAELAVPDRVEILEAVSSTSQRIRRQLRHIWEDRANAFRLSADACLLRSPQRRFETYIQRHDHGVDALHRSLRQHWQSTCKRAHLATELLRLTDPQLPLKRGYSMTTLAGDGTPLRSVASLEPGSLIETHLSDGRLHSQITEVSADDA